MSFIIGWKAKGHAFVCADSAFTTFKEFSSTHETTSFGEAVVNRPGLQVQEGGLKIVNLGRAVVAFAGDYATARKVLITLADELRHMDDIRSAFAVSISEVVTRGNALPVSLILAAPAIPEPLLLTYDGFADFPNLIELENTYGVSYGSLEGAPREHARSLIGAFMPHEADRQLQCALGVLQALGVNCNLLDQRVGGAFCGALADSSAVRWQGDTLYIVHQPGAYWCKQVVTCVRSNALIVESGIINATRVFSDSLSGGATDYLKNGAIDELREMIVECRYDFVTFLTTGMPISVVVEMQKHQESKQLRLPSCSLKELPGDVPLHIQFQVSKELMHTIAFGHPDGQSTENVARACFYFPYERPPDGSDRHGTVMPMYPDLDATNSVVARSSQPIQ